MGLDGFSLGWGGWGQLGADGGRWGWVGPGRSWWGWMGLGGGTWGQLDAVEDWVAVSDVRGWAAASDRMGGGYNLCEHVAGPLRLKGQCLAGQRDRVLYVCLEGRQRV